LYAKELSSATMPTGAGSCSRTNAFSRRKTTRR
jgi:hypothetical protein